MRHCATCRRAYDGYCLQLYSERCSFWEPHFEDILSLNEYIDYLEANPQE